MQVEDTPVAFVAGKDMSEVHYTDNAWLLTEDDIIAGFGSMETLPEGIHADEVIDAGGGFGRGHFALLHRALQLGFFQPQTVEQHQPGFADFFDVAAGEVIGMRILVCPHQVLHRHPLAADLLRHIAQNAEARHHGHGRGIKCARP